MDGWPEIETLDGDNILYGLDIAIGQLRGRVRGLSQNQKMLVEATQERDKRGEDILNRYDGLTDELYKYIGRLRKSRTKTVNAKDIADVLEAMYDRYSGGGT